MTEMVEYGNLDEIRTSKRNILEKTVVITTWVEMNEEVSRLFPQRKQPKFAKVSVM